MRTLLAVCLCAALAACAEKPTPIPPPPAPAPAPTPTPTPIPEPPPPEPTACNATENRALRLAARRATQPRIVGGEEVSPGAYPWMVAIGYYTGTGVFNYCGGTLIGPTKVLTAAHCQVIPGDVVTIGRHNLLGEEGVQVLVKRAITHANYNPSTHHNDISLLELAQPVIADAARLGEAPQAGTVRAIGWGRTSEGGPTSPVLMQVDVPIVTNAQCAATYGDIIDSQMCAGAAGRDSCQGDSGGPVLFEGEQVGVTSYGYGCAREGLPGVYTRVSSFADWIASCP